MVEATATATADDTANWSAPPRGSAFRSSGRDRKSGGATGWTHSVGNAPERPKTAPNFQPDESRENNSNPDLLNHFICYLLWLQLRSLSEGFCRYADKLTHNSAKTPMPMSATISSDGVYTWCSFNWAGNLQFNSLVLSVIMKCFMEHPDLCGVWGIKRDFCTLLKTESLRIDFKDQRQNKCIDNKVQTGAFSV